MTIPMILLPVFILVGLTFTLLVWMGQLRLASRHVDQPHGAAIVPEGDGWSMRAKQVSRAFQNQFELPLLFYTIVILAMMTRKADFLFVIMEWMFVALRLVHAGIHTTCNDVRLRFAAFTAGLLVLLVMWVLFAIRILAGF